ncbi:glycosyltransferase family 39 protein [Pimelobacter simplex]|uniref:Uncharacterized protein n=2 Tax=Nocardioides simplex TaxID=2045 RepID=A0A0A1DF05_NOCSI|nr:glycosyltransferase family 39 protein [Pimelobacter simplex]AIY15774.1 hypothetical protein KR76_01515 [Pimelobacter simplex]GEB16761.1 hypothetical protein NSI01_50760 [Pimelobacter simplex]SFM88868.1 Dolichyl-phosphate-mannose-protein mannosyltransferase [Pimelobacter simplex]
MPAPDRRVPAPRSPYVVGVLIAAGVTVLARLPFLGRPLSSDEAGYWLLARDWSPGSSLYGDYWVDRPPLLLWLFRLGDALGGPRLPADGLSVPGVRWVGLVAAGLTVLLTGLLAARVEGRRPSLLAPLLAAALLCSPLLGLPEANGEVLGVPFVVLGLALLVGALDAPAGRRTLALTAAAGGAGTAAALVKQNLVDVLVFGVVVLVLSHRHLDRVGRRLAALAAGALAVLGAALAGAAARGTSPAELADAVVTFRVEASAVIGSSASAATPARLGEVVVAFVVSGAAVVLVAAAVLVVRRALRPGPRALAVAALVLVAWEVVGVVGGGSYWLHYLTGLVPGLVLLVSVARTGTPSTPGTPGTAPRPAHRALLGACVALCVVSAGIGWGHQVRTPHRIDSDARVETWLRAHAEPTDGVVVTFGHPQVVAGSGLHSPYLHLWSLPVRVRDPELTTLRHVLDGPDAPRWVVVSGDGVATWGLDPVAARRVQAQLARTYTARVSYGVLHVWERRTP